MSHLISKSLSVIAFFSTAVVTSLTPVVAEPLCNTSNAAVNEQKQLSTIIKKTEYFMDLASQIEDGEMARQIKAKLEQAIQENQVRLEQMVDLEAQLGAEQI